MKDLFNVQALYVETFQLKLEPVLSAFLVCARLTACVRASTRTAYIGPIRGKIVDDLFSQALALRSCATECIQSAQANNNNAMRFSTLLFSPILFPVSMIQ